MEPMRAEAQSWLEVCNQTTVYFRYRIGKTLHLHAIFTP